MMGRLDHRILAGFNPEPIESTHNALMKGAALQGVQGRNALDAQHFQQVQAQMAQQAQQRNALAEFARSIPSPGMQSSQNALAGGGGPTNANAQRMAPVDPRLQMQHDLMRRGLMSPVDYVSAAHPKPKYGTAAPGATVFDEGTGKTVFTAPKEPAAAPNDVREYEYAKTQGYKGTFEQWTLAGKKAGASSTNVHVSPGGVPHQVLKQQDELIDRVTTARSIDADLGGIEQRIAAGKLKFGPIQNPYNTARNAVGFSNEESRNFATFKSTLEKLRNDSLRLNTGVQTEGDAQRAWNELFASINDQGLVTQRLGEIRQINQRAEKLHQYRLDVLRGNFSASPLPTAPVEPAIKPPPAGSGGWTVREIK